MSAPNILSTPLLFFLIPILILILISLLSPLFTPPPLLMLFSIMLYKCICVVSVSTCCAVGEMEPVLDKDAESFILKLWRMLIFNIMKAGVDDETSGR